MEEKARIILNAEDSFARRVALGTIVRRPVKPLLQLIPGMFIVDFLKRTREIRRYTRYYLFPRRAALEMALRNTRGQSGETASDEIHGETRALPGAGTLYSEEAHRALEALVRFLAGHYTRLLRADGDNHADLIRGAYGTRMQYQAFLKDLFSLEEAFEKAPAHGAPEGGLLGESLREKRGQVAEQRERDTEAIFLSP